MPKQRFKMNVLLIRLIKVGIKIFFQKNVISNVITTTKKIQKNSQIILAIFPVLSVANQIFLMNNFVENNANVVMIKLKKI